VVYLQAINLKQLRQINQEIARRDKNFMFLLWQSVLLIFDNFIKQTPLIIVQ